jgi:hypothetical protein
MLPPLNESKLISCDLDGCQRFSRFLLLPKQYSHAIGARCRADKRDWSDSISHQETIMNQLIRAGVVTLGIVGSAGFAAAQQAPGYDHSDLTPTQQRTVSQGLARSPSQPAPTAQPHVGDRLPDSMTAQALPSDVTDQVPDAKQLLFVKLPDRIILIDPDSKVVHEIVLDDSTTTAGSNSGSSDRPSR